MQQGNSNKIRLILNELAILNQPELIHGNYLFNPSTLGKIKNLAAELYINADALISAPSVQLPPGSAETPEPPIKPENQANNMMEQPESGMDVNLDANPESAEIAEAIEAPELAGEPEIPLPEPEPVIKNQGIPLEGADVFKDRLSLTRRFEYTNHLFGGDSGMLNAFLNKMGHAASLSDALAGFESEYASRNWKRKAETAEDLKQLIRKVKA